MKHTFLLLIIFLFSGQAVNANEIDRLVSIQGESCSDAVFLRRTFLVLTGQLPPMEKARTFIESAAPNKRAMLIEEVLDSEEYLKYTVMQWGDILRVKSEFPSNLWPNGVQAYNRWLYEQISANTPYDEFVRKLLVSQGSNFRSPAVNFYRAFLKRTPENTYQNIVLLFLGKRQYTDQGYLCFSQIKFKTTKEWKEEILYIDYQLNPAESVIKINNESVIQLQLGKDWRSAYVDWLTNKQNRQFAAVMANRLWYRVFGKGIVDEPDDWGTHNPPSNKALMDYLTNKFIASGYDMKAFLKLLLQSKAYQSNPAPEGMFVSQRLPAEVLVDALGDLTGISDEYRSRVPEPFSIYPKGTRAVDLGDATVSSSALELFGRVSRDVSLESQRSNKVTSRQLLYLMNARELEERIRKSEVLNQLCKQENDIIGISRAITLMTLSRFPSEKEIAMYKQYAQQNNLNIRNLASDLLWMQINSIEFLYNH